MEEIAPRASASSYTAQRSACPYSRSCMQTSPGRADPSRSSCVWQSASSWLLCLRLPGCEYSLRAGFGGLGFGADLVDAGQGGEHFTRDIHFLLELAQAGHTLLQGAIFIAFFREPRLC